MKRLAAFVVGVCMMAPAVAAEESICLLTPAETVDLGSPVEGMLAAVLVDRGDVVHKGEVVAQLTAGVEKATLDRAHERAVDTAAIDEAKVALAQQQAKLDRKQELFDRKVISAQDMDDQRFETEKAAKALKQAEFDQKLAMLDEKVAAETLALRSITSPIDGVVLQKTLSAGEYSSAQSTILKVAELDPLYAELTLPAEQFGTVKVGMKAELHLLDPVDATRIGKVNVVDPLIDAASRTFGVRVAIDNPGNSLPSGVRCAVQRWIN